MSAAITQFKGYAIHDQKKWNEFKVIEFQSKTLSDDDIEIAIEWCAICGSDVHTITGGWGPCILPMITGHEIAGRAVRVGSNVKTIKVGDRVGVGAQCFSCLQCKNCNSHNENYCLKMVDTYNAKYPNGEIAHGGYANGIRVHERFCFPIPKELELEYVAPMFCGGLTVYSPLARHGCKQGSKVAVVGIGGLGHFAVLFAVALGAHVTVFSHSKSKEADARKMGAEDFVLTDEGFHEKYAQTFDIILSTRDVAKGFPLAEFCGMLAVHGKFVLCGLPDEALPSFKATTLLFNGSMIVGSHIGSKKEVEDMLKLAVEKNVKPWIQKYEMKDVEKAVSSVKNGTVRYRAVMKMDIV